MAITNFALKNHSYVFTRVEPSVAKFFAPTKRGLSYGRTTVPTMRATTGPEIQSRVTTERRSANYKLSIWNHEFMESLKRDHAALQDKFAKVERLKCEVKAMVVDEGLEPLKVLQLIDDIQRLGLGNHFGKDIESALSRVACNFGDLNLDHHATALGFRLFRQSGIMISQDVFKQFMDEKGKFRPSLGNDIEGMISLYEASYLSFEGEHILDEAKAFTTKHLMNYMNYKSELPLRYRLPRLEARRYVERNATSDDAKNAMAVFELAKLDYNMTQLKYQEDLYEMSRWWRVLGLSDNLRFARDRLMECCFWGTSTASKPELSLCRKALTKVFKFVTILDDIYDIYGEIPELELFTNAVERWDINAIEVLPDYLKLAFLALYNTVNEIGYEILKQKGYNCVPFLKKAWEDLCKAFLEEAKWFYYGQTPTYEEYLDVGCVSASGITALTHAFFLVSPEITPQALDCVENSHDILRLPSMVFRLTNDLATFEAEIERGETANAISCYAMKTGISIEDASKHVSMMIEECWKKMNEIQVINKTPFSNDFIEIAMNLARTSQCTYQRGDGHGSPELIKKQILSTLADPV